MFKSFSFILLAVVFSSPEDNAVTTLVESEGADIVKVAELWYNCGSSSAENLACNPRDVGVRCCVGPADLNISKYTCRAPGFCCGDNVKIRKKKKTVKGSNPTNRFNYKNKKKPKRPKRSECPATNMDFSDLVNAPDSPQFETEGSDIIKVAEDYYNCGASSAENLPCNPSHETVRCCVGPMDLVENKTTCREVGYCNGDDPSLQDPNKGLKGENEVSFFQIPK